MTSVTNIDLLECFEFYKIQMLLYDGNEEILMNNLLALMKGKRIILRLLSEDRKQEAIEIFNKAGYFTATTKTRIMVSKYVL